MDSKKKEDQKLPFQPRMSHVKSHTANDTQYPSINEVMDEMKMGVTYKARSIPPKSNNPKKNKVQVYNKRRSEASILITTTLADRKPKNNKNSQQKQSNKKHPRIRADTYNPKTKTQNTKRQTTYANGNHHNNSNISNNNNNTNTRPKSVKFSARNKGRNGMRKTIHLPSTNGSKGGNNGLLLLGTNGSNNKGNKRRNMKPRASYSVGKVGKYFHSGKRQLLTQSPQTMELQQSHPLRRSRSIKFASMSKQSQEDDQFLNSLVEPMKKKELSASITKLKEVIESDVNGNLSGSTTMSLRQVLRKLQLLRLDVTLREYRQSKSVPISPEQSMESMDSEENSDLEMNEIMIANCKPKLGDSHSNKVHSSHNSASSMHVQSTSKIPLNNYTIQEEQVNTPSSDDDDHRNLKMKGYTPINPKLETINEPIRIRSNSHGCIEIDRSKLQLKNRNKMIMNAMKKNQSYDDEKLSERAKSAGELNNMNTQDANCVNSHVISALLLQTSNYNRNHYYNVVNANKFQRRRFSIDAPNDNDRAGIEVARWLSNSYSTFGRYNHDNAQQQKRSSMNSNKSKEELDKEREKNKEKEELLNIQRESIDFMKLISSQKILHACDGIGIDWNWCIFELYEICGDSILLIIAHYIFCELNLFEKFNINFNKFRRFFSTIQKGYMANPYHSALHGADVLVNIYFWIQSSAEYKSYLSDLDKMIALVSAACHDYKHPGLTQNYHVLANTELALLYNGRSVLENMHCSETIRVMLSPTCRIFESLKKSEFRYVRELTTDMILGTDMQMHSDHVKNSKEIFLEYFNCENGRDKIKEENLEELRKNILVIGLHVADIANPCKSWNDCKRWTYMLMEEWFRQGDQELAQSLEVSPMMDREKPNIPRGQIGFIDYIVRPLFENWSKLFVETGVCLQNLMENKEKWNQLLTDPTANIVSKQLNGFNIKGVKALKINAKKKTLNVNINGKSENNNKVVINGDSNNSNNDGNNDNNNNNNNDNSNDINIPFTPDQAKALHVYDDVMQSAAMD